MKRTTLYRRYKSGMLKLLPDTPECEMVDADSPRLTRSERRAILTMQRSGDQFLRMQHPQPYPRDTGGQRNTLMRRADAWMWQNPGRRPKPPRPPIERRELSELARRIVEHFSGKGAEA